MSNTSKGYHTFAFFQKMKEDEYSCLENDFIGYMQKTGKMKRSPIMDKNKKMSGWQFTYKNIIDRGIRWLLMSNEIKSGYVTRGVMAVITPRVLIKNDYIAVAEENDLGRVEELFNEKAAEISPLLLKFGACSLGRLDPCLNIDLKELDYPCSPEQMMLLIKQGNIPKHYEERKKIYDEKQHRRITDKDSLYLESKSCVINYYWKYHKQTEKHPNFLFRESSHNVIRLEVQCKYLKLYMLSKDIRHESKFYISNDNISIEDAYKRMIDDVHNPSIPIDVMLTENIYDNIIRKNFYRVLRKGDYFTLDDARRIVESYHFKRNKEERIIDTLELVNKYRGIARAKSRLYGPDLDDFNRSLKDLDNVWINPVTIPRRWNIKHIPNLLRAYDEMGIEEQLMSKQEYLAWKHIEDSLSN